MQKTAHLVIGAAFGIFLTATCSHMAPGGAGAQSGPTRMLTADTDVNQLAAGKLLLDNATPHQKVLDGPFVFTALFVSQYATLSVVAGGQDCSAATVADPAARRIDTSVDRQDAMHRIVVKPGEEVCVSYNGPTGAAGDSMTWSGWKPY